jgi:hypothetical protein
MERNGLFFDPLQGEGRRPEENLLEQDDDRPESPAAPRRRRLDPEEVQVQRRREMDRVQEELRKMASGLPVVISPSRRDRAGSRFGQASDEGRSM